MTDAVRSKAEDPLPGGAETRRVALIKCAPLPWLPVASDPQRSGASGARSRARSDRISRNIRRDTATLTVWKVK